MDVSQLSEALEEFLRSTTGSPVRVAKAWRMAGGASRDCWGVDLEIESGPEKGHRELVLRRDLGGTIHSQSLSRAEEFRVLRAAHLRGVLAPRPRWLCEDGALLGGPFFLMDRLSGVALGGKVVRAAEFFEARTMLPSQMGRELATIHSIPLVDEIASLPRPAAGESPAHAALAAALSSLRDRQEPHPALELTARWLEARVGSSDRLTLVHGDFRVGNLLVTPEGLRGILDWEFAHIGDPLEDLAWPCVRAWRFGRDDKRLGGVGDPELFWDTYEAASGVALDRRRIPFWEVMGNFRWAIACLAQADRHLSGAERSVELAVLGRKAAEVEWELMELMCTLDRRS